ncbi:hypothetical protein BLNAU_6139 [Blattamonas nauphoetae]|uniref:Uncharacterized protein n=1 Tax=Blattamonas nauphoetae TaxID=2049346 RepID=A0ABQ9Y562_9EUKA|nr:hypothetical protein BLNAU_6139 [Blattamonas nauphoetae]
MTCETSLNTSNISTLLERLKGDDEDILIETLGELQRVAGDIALSAFDEIVDEAPSQAVLTTLARISLYPNLRIAYNSLDSLRMIIYQYPPAFALLPSPIFPSSSPLQQYSGLDYLEALSKKVKTIFSKFQTRLQIDYQSLLDANQVTTDEIIIVESNLDFCSHSWELPVFLLRASPPIEVDPEIIRDFIIFVKDALPPVLSTIASIDNFITSLDSNPSPTSPHTPSLSGDDELTQFPLQSDSFMSSFESIVLDDFSFPDLILKSLLHTDDETRSDIMYVVNFVVEDFQEMRDRFISANLVGRMFETVDFVSLPLSDTKIHMELTQFLALMAEPIDEDDETYLEHLQLLRVSVFEPAKQYILFIFHNCDNFRWDEIDQGLLANYICWLDSSMKDMELHNEEHDADIVSELVRWEARQMVEMENGTTFGIMFQSIGYRTKGWMEDNPERQKRREVRLREEGWDDALELRVVGIEEDTPEDVKDDALDLRVMFSFNSDEN